MTTEMGTAATERVLAALEGVRPSGDGWVALCPAHDDHNPSLSITPADDRVLLHCHAECKTTDVLAGAGLQPHHLFDHPHAGGGGGMQVESDGETELLPRSFTDSYNYTSPTSVLFFQVLRGRDAQGKKTFRQRRPDRENPDGWTWSLKDLPSEQREIPYLLPELLAAKKAGKTIWVVEGEKDVEALDDAGITATCNAQGAGKWTANHAAYLHDADVVIVADKDKPGYAHATKVAQTLAGVAASIRVVEAAQGKDAADHLAAGHTPEDFIPVELDSSTEEESSDHPDDSPANSSASARGADVGEAHGSQARMAYRLAKHYAGKLLYAHGIGWLTWDGTRWSGNDHGAPTRAVLDVLRLALSGSLGNKKLRTDVGKCETGAGVAGVLTLAAALEPFAATVADLDADPYLLNVANGTLDLRTMELRPHNPADRITKVTRAAWDSDTPTATWGTFLTQVLPDTEVREFLQRVAGVGLLGIVVEHVLPILTGVGSNGKGTFYKAVNYALGDYASTVEPDLFLHRQGAHPTGEMDLLGIRWCVVSETEKDRRLAEATMKRLTGGDTIRARRMKKDFVEFTPSHTAVMITNHLPKVSGDDPAIWRRLRVVPFDVVIPPAQVDKHMDERLQADADAVLAWAVAGYADYAGREELAEPPSVLTATDKYHKSSDAVARFLDEQTTRGSGFATIADLFARWVRWSLVDGTEPISQRAFGEALDTHGLPGAKSNGKHIRRGVILNAEDDAF